MLWTCLFKFHKIKMNLLSKLSCHTRYRAALAQRALLHLSSTTPAAGFSACFPDSSAFFGRVVFRKEHFMAGVNLNVPPLQVKICLNGRPNIQMPHGTFCTAILFPSTEQKMIIVAMDQDNTFKIPATQLSLRNDASVYTKVDPALILRVSAEGNQIMNTFSNREQDAPKIQQHMVTAFLHLSQLMPCLASGRQFQMHLTTHEDEQSYIISVSGTPGAYDMQQYMNESMKILSAHRQNMQQVHGRKLILVPEAVKVCNDGRERRWTEIKTAFQKLFGDQQGIAEWFLCMNRLFNGMKIDMAQSNYLRKFAVHMEPEFNAVMLVFICAGMMSELTHESSAAMTSEEAVKNAVDMWCLNTRDQIQDLFLKHLHRHNSTTTAYLSDAGYEVQGARMVCLSEAKEDQNTFASLPLEAVLNYMLFKLNMKVGDCEDLTAMMAGVVDLFDLPRQQFFSVVGNAVSSIPVYFKNQPAASDFTAHPQSLQTLAMKLWDSFQSPAPVYRTQICSYHDLVQVLTGPMDANMCEDTSIASILARAPRLDQTTLGNESRSTQMSLEKYSEAWQSELIPGKHEGSGLQGHACGVRDSFRTLGVVGNVRLDLVLGQPQIMESTSNAVKCKENGLGTSFFGTHTPERLMIREKLGEAAVLPQNLTCNIESTLLCSELRMHMPSDTAVFASQNYTLGDMSGRGAFYTLKLNTMGANFTMSLNHKGLPTAKPGHPMDKDAASSGWVQLRMTAQMGADEQDCLQVMSSIGAELSLKMKTLSEQNMLPPINPFQSRCPMKIEKLELQPVPPINLKTETMNTGCTLKYCCSQIVDCHQEKTAEIFIP
jgi:hypothetical protein